MTDCALQATAMPDHTCHGSLPTTAQSVNSLLTQQVPVRAAPATGCGQMDLLLCDRSGFQPSSPLPLTSLQLMLLPCLNPSHCN